MVIENFTLTDRLPNNNVSQEINATLVFRCFMFTDSNALKILMVIGYSVLITTSLIGNFILTCVFFTNKTMRNNVNCYIMNMVLADLLLTLVYMPRMIGRILIGLEWPVEGTTGLILCKLVSLSQEISICVSILTVVIVAFERLFAVAFPLREIISRKLSLGLLCGTWIVSLAVRFPMLYSVKTVSFQSGKFGCFWIHSLSFSTKEARKFYHSFIIYFIIIYFLWPAPSVHNDLVHCHLDHSKAKANPCGKCGYKQESHPDDNCSNNSFYTLLVVVFYCDTDAGVLECPSDV